MRTKIVATLGPATDSLKLVRALIEAGVDVFRLNFSHGTQEEHAARFGRIRKAAKSLQANVCVLQDLQGPKMRVGSLKGGGPVDLVSGRPTTITTRAVVGDAECFSSSYRALHKDVHRGDRILLDDGLIELRVEGVSGRDVRCEVVNGGPLGEHKGINLPGVDVSAPALSAKDRRDLEFGLGLGVDAIALSFVRRAADVRVARRFVQRIVGGTSTSRGSRRVDTPPTIRHTPLTGGEVPIIAKIEKPEAIEELEAILDAADGVMVARGDLGVEMAPEQVPVLQKRIIQRANALGKPVITATQMLESMVREPRPTRAEASDVANAIFDSTDAVMLSAETAVGQFPLEAVQMMARIAEAAESVKRRRHPDEAAPLPVAAAIADAAVHAAEDIDAACLVVFTISGATARLVAQRRPPCPIHAFSPVDATCRRLALVWGVEAHPVAMARATDTLVASAERLLVRLNAVRPGGRIVLVAGTTPLAGATDMVKVLRIG